MNKSRINDFYQLLILFIILAGIIALIFVNHYKKSKEREYFNENILSLDMAYQSSINKHELLTKYIFKESINTELILSLFERGLNSKDDVRYLYKGLLYKEVYPLYLRLKKEGISQFHFHTKNNKSYIRFHKPNKYGDDLSKIRETVRLANKENKIVSGFEIGRLFSGFRNIFPINFKNEHIGSFEIGISTKMMIEAISKLDKRREYSFILNKDIVFNKLLESQKFLYQTSMINPNFVIEDKEASFLDSPRKLSHLAKEINKKLNKNRKLKEVMAKGEKYGLFVKLHDIYYDVTFIPMLSISNKVEGYLISYKKSTNIPFIVKMEIYIYFLILLGVIVHIKLLLSLQKKTKILNAEREWFKSITDNLGEGLFVMDLNAKINYINPIACKILGYKEKEVIGKNAHTLFHSHSFNSNMKQKDCPIFNEVMNNNFFYSKKEYFMNSKGKNFPVSLKSRIIIRSDDDMEIITSFSDISIQKALEDESALLMKALESSINCILITDKDGNVEWGNKAFEELTGFEINEIKGKNPKEFISSKKQNEEFYTDMWETILNKKPWKGELINKKKDGTLYDEELIITPVLDEDNEIVNFIAVKEDITEKKLMLLEKEAKDKLFFQQSKMAAMGEMLGNIAHQWRQPLSAISTAATGTKLQKEMNVLTDSDFDYAMDLINNSTQYLSHTIDDFRSFFDVKNSKESKFFILDSIKKVLNLVSSQFVSKEIEIIKKIQNVAIVSLENELIQVLLNILNNSKDALVKLKDEEKLLFINTYVKDKKLIVEIKDNARGIKEELLEKIFEPYFTTKHKSQGTGIGLYMSQDIIRNHLDGEILVENEIYEYKGMKYKGAKFTIIINIK
ncbi:MAG: PAS domain S-box protein [Halarcobacter sp.]